MRKAIIAALAALALTAGGAAAPANAGNSAGDSDTKRQHQRCAREFHAAVVEDNEAYNARDAERYERILNPRMIFWYDGVVTYGRDAIMATARANFAVPNWIWTYEILSETVYGCESGIAVLETHNINTATGVDREFAVTMGLVREHGRWTVAIDNVHLIPLPA